MVTGVHGSLTSARCIKYKSLGCEQQPVKHGKQQLQLRKCCFLQYLCLPNEGKCGISKAKRGLACYVLYE